MERQLLEGMKYLSEDLYGGTDIDLAIREGARDVRQRATKEKSPELLLITDGQDTITAGAVYAAIGKMRDTTVSYEAIARRLASGRLGGGSEASTRECVLSRAVHGWEIPLISCVGTLSELVASSDPRQGFHTYFYN